jgi:hypothetical protein
MGLFKYNMKLQYKLEHLKSLVMDAKAFVQHYEMQSVPHHKNNEKGGSPLDLEGSHKCNGSSW